MSEVIHRSEITITRERGPVRRAVIKGVDEPIYYGVHGGIKNFYNVEPVEEHAATLDHLVAAVGGWMMGTFAAVLAKSKIRTGNDRYAAKVFGDIEAVEGILKIVRINVQYSLKLPPEKRQEAQQAFSIYLPGCPAAQSVIGCIEISHQLLLEDEEEQADIH